MKAMILAAGRGSRLRPLTDSIPKPLVPIRDTPLIEYTILRLKKAGIYELVINVCYMKEAIKEALGNGEKYGVSITYSEEQELLEVGGSVVHAMPLLGKAPFLIVNGDIWTDYPFEKLIEKSHDLNMLAHIVLVNNLAKHPHGDFGIEEGRLLSGEEIHPKFTYSGIALLKPEFFAGHSEGKIWLRPLLEQAIQTGTISAEYYSGEFSDVGTMNCWQELNARLLIRGE